MENTNIPQNMPMPAVAETPPVQHVWKREFTMVDSVISIICFALGLMFTHFVCEYAGGLWGGIMWLLFGITGAAYVKLKKIPVKRSQAVIFGVALIFCFTPLFCANSLINFLAAAFTFLLYIYLCITLSGAEPFSEHFVYDLFKSVWYQPFSCYGDGARAAGKLLKNKKAGKNVGFAILGLIIALPLSVIVLMLLSFSDNGFNSLVNNIFNSLPEFDMIYGVEFAFAFVVWLYLFGALSSAAEPVAPKYFSSAKLRIVPNALGYTAVTPICFFYAVYIAMQFRYFTAAFTGVLPEGVSYSSYARQGFFELCVIAVINLAVIVFLQCFMQRKEDDKPTTPLKVYTTMISVFTLFLIASAISKMVLYINEMGMTPLRVYTSWFMILLAIIFVLIIISQFANIKFWKTAFVSFALMMSILCFGNIDGMIADYNVTAYETGKLESIDFGVLEDLGTPALKHIERLFDAEEKLIAEKAIWAHKFIIEENAEYNGFAYFSISGGLR